MSDIKTPKKLIEVALPLDDINAAAACEKMYPKYENYKDSGVEWLGEIPGHWSVLPGMTCIQESKQKNIGLIEDTVLSLSYGRIIIKPKEKLTGLVPESFETYQIIKPGDIIIRATDLQNDKTSLRTGISHNNGIITSAYLNLRPKKHVNPEFIHFSLHSYDVTKVFYGMGSGLRQNLDYRDFKRLPIVLPSLEEQNRIANFLDRKTAAIDDAIAKKQRLIELLKEQKAILINRAVTQGLNPDVPMKDSGVEWIGEIPAHWQVKKLKHLTNGIIDSEHKTAPSIDNGYFLIVRTSNVKNGELVLDNAQFTNQKIYLEWTKRAVPKSGDVLLTREAPAGEACVLEKDNFALLGQRMVLLRIKKTLINPYFLVSSIYQGAAKRFIDLLSVGSTVAHFNMSDIKNIPVLLPDLKEQVEISNHIAKLTEKIDNSVIFELSMINKLQEYKQILISHAVTGKIKVS